MQKVAGTLNPGAHAGSYNGQDAYNDLLVVDGKNIHNTQTVFSHSGAGELCGEPNGKRLQRPANNYQDGGGMEMDSVVRRLTPTECERLQGFPDGWTDIGEWTDSKGKLHKESSDASRYKALGNSIALPFWEWMARRICAQYERPMTMGSLFDGIGGFPLAFERAGAKAIWASEIEEFPIAVTKARFPE